MTDLRATFSGYGSNLIQEARLLGPLNELFSVRAFRKDRCVIFEYKSFEAYPAIMHLEYASSKIIKTKDRLHCDCYRPTAGTNFDTTYYVQSILASCWDSYDYCNCPLGVFELNVTSLTLSFMFRCNKLYLGILFFWFPSDLSWQYFKFIIWMMCTRWLVP